LIAWFGMMLLAIGNGIVRDLVYRDGMGEFRAHQLSTIALLVVFGGYFWMLFTVWPLASYSQAWTVGTLWLAMTLAFEFGFGRWVSSQSWQQLWRAYRLHEGQLWPLIPLWVWIGPAVFFQVLSA
jgi:uncharacterized membrane protein